MFTRIIIWLTFFFFLEKVILYCGIQYRKKIKSNFSQSKASLD